MTTVTAQAIYSHGKDRCHKMRLTFIRKSLNGANQSVKVFTRLFILGDDFRKLCSVIEIDTIHLYKLSFGAVN